MPPKKPIAAPTSLGFNFGPDSEAITRPRLPVTPPPITAPPVIPTVSPEDLDAFDDYQPEQEPEADPAPVFPHVSVVRDGESFVVSRMVAMTQYARVIYTRSELEELIARAAEALATGDNR